MPTAPVRTCSKGEPRRRRSLPPPPESVHVRTDLAPARCSCLRSGHRRDAEPPLVPCSVPFVVAGEGVEGEVVVGEH
jgi:hypothetical protein